MFEQATQHYLNMSADEFLAKYEAGDLPDPDQPYNPGLHHVLGLMGFVQP